MDRRRGSHALPAWAWATVLASVLVILVGALEDEDGRSPDVTTPPTVNQDLPGATNSPPTTAPTTTAPSTTAVPSTTVVPVTTAPTTVAVPVTTPVPVTAATAPATRPPAPTPAPSPAPAPVPAGPPPTQRPPEPSSGCHPSYAGACVPIDDDVDCNRSANGPSYVDARNFHVVGPDVYRLDADNDGIACES